MVEFKHVVKLDNGRPSTDGRLVRYETHCRDGEVIGLEMPVKNLGNYIAFLAGLAQTADQYKSQEQRDRELAKGFFEGALIDVLRMGFAQGRTPQEVVLSFQIGEFSIGFSVDTNALPALQAAIAHLEPNEPQFQH